VNWTKCFDSIFNCIIPCTGSVDAKRACFVKTLSIALFNHILLEMLNINLSDLDGELNYKNLNKEKS